MKAVATLTIFASLTAIGATAFFIGTGKSEATSVQATEQQQTVVREMKTTEPNDTVVKTDKKVTTTLDYYKSAVDEMTEMLNGQKLLSFKRAVFLTENAYYNGQLD